MRRRAIAATLLALSSSSCTQAGSVISSSTVATCPPGAELGREGCTCRRDLELVVGACVSPRTAAEHCGALALPTGAGCAPRSPCERGRARDLQTSACLPVRDVRALASASGILARDEDLVGCEPGFVLVADGEVSSGPTRLGCVRGEPSEPAARCPAGSLVGPKGTCAAVYERGRVDVVAWARAVLGPGGAGAPPLVCEALGRRPGAIDRETDAAVSLVFPDNDVSLVRSTATAELEPALRPMIEALRALGGTATQATVVARVRCGAGAGGRARRPAALAPENDHGK